MGTALAGMGMGTNVGNDAPPDLPTESRTTDVEAWRARMEAKRDAAQVHRSAQVAAARSAGVGRGDHTTPLPVTPGAPVDDDPPVAGVVADGSVPKPGLPRQPAPRVHPDQAMRLAMVTAYLAGDTTHQIADRHGCAATTVTKHLRAAGVTLRAPGWAGRVPVAPDTAPVVLAFDGSRSGDTTVISVPTQTDVPTGVPAGAGQGPGRLVDDAEADVITAAYLGGESAVAIGARHGRNPSTIRAALRRGGVVVRDDRATLSGGVKKVDDPATVSRVRELYVDQSLTQMQVAAHLGASAKFVQGVMARNGIESRPDATGRTPDPRPLNPAGRVSRPLADPTPDIPGGPPTAPENPVTPLAAAGDLASHVDEVARSLQAVVDATEQLLDAQTAVAVLRVRRLRDLASELLVVLDRPHQIGASR